MSVPVHDLWPDIRAVPIVPPIAILREQAQLLAEKTGGLLHGEVTSASLPGVRRSVPSVTNAAEMSLSATASGPAVDLVHTFHIVAPSLSNYRYSLLNVRHDYRLYPAVVLYLPIGTVYEVPSSEEFESRLRELFAHEETLRVLGSLLVQIQP